MAERRLKAVFVLPNLAAGGAERVLITLMNGLDRARFEPVLLSLGAEGPLAALIAPGIPLETLSARGGTLRTLPALFRALRRHRPDLVVSTLAPVNFAVLLLRPFFPQARFAVRETTPPSRIFEARPRETPLIRCLYRFLYPKAALVISPAALITGEFHGLLRLPASNIAALPNPVDVALLRRETRLPPAEPQRAQTVHFIAAGRLHRAKGFDRLIEALPGLDLPAWRLTILGEGPERAALERLIAARGLQDRVQLPGLTLNPWPAYAAADAFLLPSRLEGLPNVVLESLACGTPVIATAESGGIAEIAAQAPPGAVTVVNTMDEFIAAMARVNPAPPAEFRPPLLPEMYYRENVVREFSALLEKISPA